MSKIRILMLVGSFRKESFNRPVAETIAGFLAPRCDVKFLEYDHILPMDNGGMPDPIPVNLIRLRKEVVNSDAIWVVKPQDQDKAPESLKTLLRWLGTPVEFGATWGNRTVLKNKPATFTGVGEPGSSQRYFEDLEPVLKERNMLVMEEKPVFIEPANGFNVDDKAILEDHKGELAMQASRFVDFIEKHVPSETLAGNTKVV